MTETQDKDQISFLRGLRAIRSFRPDPVPPEVVDDILEPTFRTPLHKISTLAQSYANTAKTPHYVALLASLVHRSLDSDSSRAPITVRKGDFEEHLLLRRHVAPGLEPKSG